MKYREAIITVITGSSSHFEIAIATALAMKFYLRKFSQSFFIFCRILLLSQ